MMSQKGNTNPVLTSRDRLFNIVTSACILIYMYQPNKLKLDGLSTFRSDNLVIDFKQSTRIVPGL